jgi:integrase
VSGRNLSGEGSVYQRKDGRWVAAVYLPVVGAGPKRVSVYAKTRAEANPKLRELVDRAEKNIPIATAGLTVESYLAEWLEYVRKHIRPSSYSGYETNVRLHLVPRIGRKKLTRLSVRDVRLLVDGLRADGLKARSIQYAHATLRSALEHAVREELVARNVAKLVRVEQPTTLKPPEPLSVDEARKLLNAVRGHRLEALCGPVSSAATRPGLATPTG